MRGKGRGGVRGKGRGGVRGKGRGGVRGKGRGGVRGKGRGGVRGKGRGRREGEMGGEWEGRSERGGEGRWEGGVQWCLTHQRWLRHTQWWGESMLLTNGTTKFLHTFHKNCMAQYSVDHTGGMVSGDMGGGGLS